MAFQEREVCCCGARTWTLVIGWIEIILSAVMLFMTMVSLVVLSTSEMNPSQYGHISNGQRVASNKVLIVAEVIVAILYALNVFMNVVLLRGTYKKNPHQINAWLIFTLIFTIIFAVMMFALLFIIPLGQAPVLVFSTCVMVAVEGFFIWVVGIHKAEIQASTGVTITYKV